MSDAFSQPGMIDEHQPRGEAMSGAGEQTEEEKRTNKLVEQLLGKAKNYRKRYDQNWVEYYKVFRGKQWREQRPSYRHSEVINLVFQGIQGQIPILTDSKPRIEYLPQEPSDFEVSQILTDVASADWDANNWQLKLVENLLEAHLYGTGLAEVCYNQKAKFGLGAIEYKSTDPLYFYPDPDAWDVNERCRFVCYAEPVDIEVLKRDYPKKAKFLKGDLNDLTHGSKWELGKTEYRTAVTQRMVTDGEGVFDLENRNQALKITCYLKPDEYIEEEKDKIDENGVAQKVYEQRLKYPKGRKIVTACGQVLEDGPIPYDDGLFPYARLINYCLPREFWGMGDVEQTLSPQRMFNKLLSFALDVMTLMGNPVWVVDTSAGIDTDNLVNRPGLVIEKEPGSEVRREAGLPVPPDVLNLADKLKSWFDDVIGQHDVSRGTRPADVSAGIAIQSLQDSDRTRIRQKARNLDAFLQSFGQMYASRAFQFYSVPRVFRLTNNQSAQKYFKMHIATEMGQDGQPVLDQAGRPQRKMVIQDYVKNDETGQYSDGPIRELQIRGEFDVKVTTGSSLPFAKEEKKSIAFKLLEAGVIDPEEVLKQLEYPNAEAVLARMSEKAAAQAQAEAQGQAGPPPSAA